jgi:hypothetical protein
MRALKTYDTASDVVRMVESRCFVFLAALGTRREPRDSLPIALRYHNLKYPATFP